MKKQVIVKLQIEGLHNWPDAKTVEPQVAFLSHMHRHIFHIKAIKEVSHSEREIEIIKFKREVTDYLHRNYYDIHLDIHNFGGRSCETIAQDILEAYDLDLCEVLEDNENGSICLK